MLTTLLLLGLTLREGLKIRHRRRRGEATDTASIRRHLRVSKPAVILCLIGFAGGPTSSVLFRGWAPLEHLHGWLGLLATALFTATFVLGRKLERARGQGGPVEAHARAGLVAVLVAGLAAFAGFVLLP